MPTSGTEHHLPLLFRAGRRCSERRDSLVRVAAQFYLSAARALRIGSAIVLEALVSLWHYSRAAVTVHEDWRVGRGRTNMRAIARRSREAGICLRESFY